MKDSDSLQVIHFQGNTAREITDERFDDTNWNMPGEVQETIFGNQAITPSGQTPLGDAIEALSSFHSNPTPDDTRHATIVFTDGHENGCPRVFVPVNNCSRVVHKVNNQKAVIEKATFYAIGVSGSDETLLNRIAADLGTPGTSAYTLNPEDVQLLFECTIPELFRGCTPRIITFKRGTTPNTPPNRLTESFRVDSLVRKLTINLRCRSGNCGFNDDGLELRRNGRPVNARPTFVANDEIRYAIDLPLIDTTAGTALDGGGAWTLLCPATRGSDYELMVMVDDKRLAVNTTVNNNQAVYAGDPITVRTEATYLGRAFNGLEAEAFLLAPGEDPGALFATTNIDPPAPQEPSPGPGMSLGSLQAQAKISGLLVREDILARLAYRSNGIPLTRTADGRFTGTFPAPLTEVSSHYRIMVRYKGYQVGLDSIQGMTIDHFHVRFGRSEEIDLNAKVVKTGTGDQLTSYRYQFRPTNKFGNPVGPAQAQNISVLVDGKPTILQDQLDGTYTTNVNTAYGGRPKVAVYVNDRNKPVSKRRLGPAIGLSLHSGILRMRQAPAPYDGLPDGTYYEADLTARLTGSFDLEAIVGQNDFGDNLRILEAGLFAGLTLPQPAIAGFKPRIQAGLSYFKPDALDGQLGGGARLGLARFFGPNLQIGLEGGGSYLFDSELLFLKGGLFIKYFF